MAIKKRTAVISAVAVVGLFLTLSMVGVLGAPKQARVTGINVGVFSDSKCRVNCTAIDWGNISPGDVVTKTVYVKNTGEGRVSLSLSASNWSPSEAESVLKLTWNLGKRSLGVGKVVPAILTLTVASELGSLASFKFTISITGTQKLK